MWCCYWLGGYIDMRLLLALGWSRCIPSQSHHPLLLPHVVYWKLWIGTFGFLAGLQQRPLHLLVGVFVRPPLCVDACTLLPFEIWLAPTVISKRPAVPTRAVPMLLRSGCNGWDSVNLFHQVDRLQLWFMTTLYRHVGGERCRSLDRGRTWSFSKGICCRGARLGLL